MSKLLSEQPWTEDRFRELAVRALHGEPQAQPANLTSDRSRLRSDFDLNPELDAVKEIAKSPRPAAVLVPVVAHNELTVLLTQRTEHLPSHAGQVAFPGGKLEPSDASPLAAALRETMEEIGLVSSAIEPLGYLDGYLTGTGFHVVPVVALVQPEFNLTLDEREVADAFEVPLSFLMDSSNHETHTREWRGTQRSYYAMPYGDRFIWGATAGMIRNLHERLARA
ncbi:MAG: CoA pyrophosphatase [Pseudomonadota bacterium]